MNDYPSGYALFLLRQAVELFEMGDQCNDPGTMEWVWLQQARDVLEDTETDNFPPSHGTPDFITGGLDDFCRAGFGEIKASGELYHCMIDTLTLPSEIYHDNLDKVTLQFDDINHEANLAWGAVDFDLGTMSVGLQPRWHTTRWDIESSNWPSVPELIVPSSDGEDTFESYTVEMAVEPAYESPDDILFAPVKTT